MLYVGCEYIYAGKPTHHERIVENNIATQSRSMTLTETWLKPRSNSTFATTRA